ncbi:hypothetical protein DBR11_14255 [Pedobacter sp. HMWF019]|uniref:helix-turn-helix domain-containing protein n=1 Tax=Pedobacter sp. HMWF019 TaxID=2056856 RepID=UPI000D393494|nr:helix-turn-helix domain-containing protein [Pedobacter sp. HMWF019]PTS98667.1 hypothetical protein DBR11_14255 [Pedobacter sp. HMWF019]
MKTQQHKIKQFQLSPWAKAGLAIKNLRSEKSEEEHDSSKPHRDHHYLVILITNGQFTINLDFKEINIIAPKLLFVFPEQVHNITEIKNPSGWAVSFDPSLISNTLQTLLEKNLKGPIELEKQTDFYQYTTSLMDLMEQLQSKGLSGHSIKAAHSVLNAILELTAEKTIAATIYINATTTSRAVAIEQEFNQLLKQHYKNWKQPTQYAAALHISVAHLYDTMKGMTGTSVSELIQQCSILEAKRLLYFTDLSVKEIGYELGYNEPVYFGKLFKKTTGLTPLQFRHQYRD